MLLELFRSENVILIFLLSITSGKLKSQKNTNVNRQVQKRAMRTLIKSNRGYYILYIYSSFGIKVPVGTVIPCLYYVSSVLWMLILLVIFKPQNK